MASAAALALAPPGGETATNAAGGRIFSMKQWSEKYLPGKVLRNPKNVIRQTPANSLRQLLNVEMENFLQYINRAGNTIDRSIIIRQIEFFIKNISEKYSKISGTNKLELGQRALRVRRVLEQLKEKLNRNNSETITVTTLLKNIITISKKNARPGDFSFLDVHNNAAAAAAAAAAAPAPAPAPAALSPIYFKHGDKVYKVIRENSDTVFASELILIPSPGWSKTETEFTKATVDTAEKIPCTTVHTGGARKSRRRHRRQKKQRKTRRA